MDMRERIARAIYDRMGFGFDMPWDRALQIREAHKDLYPGPHSIHQGKCFIAADAVLEAMVTFENFGDAATQAGAQIIGTGQTDPLAWQNCHQAQMIFKAMLTAARKPERSD